MSLLRAILENPHDDQLRLVYSDWLDEQGDSTRAEFIRLQIEISRINPRDCNQSLCEQYGHGLCSHRRNVKGLRDLNGEMLSHGGGYFRWSPFGESYSLHKTHHQAITYKRGFVEEVSLPLVVFMEEMLLLFSTNPVLKVSITDKAPYQSGYDQLWVWRWSPERPTGYPHDTDPPDNLLPKEVWDALPEPVRFDAPGNRARGKVCDNEQDGKNSLSRALVNLGRKCAGLPALEWK